MNVRKTMADASTSAWTLLAVTIVHVGKDLLLKKTNMAARRVNSQYCFTTKLKDVISPEQGVSMSIKAMLELNECLGEWIRTQIIPPRKSWAWKILGAESSWYWAEKGHGLGKAKFIFWTTDIKKQLLWHLLFVLIKMKYKCKIKQPTHFDGSLLTSRFS